MIEQYFDRISQCSTNTKYPPRIRFMLRDLIELRRNGWVPRKLVNTEGPVPMQQLRPDDDVIHTPFVNRSQRDQRNNDRDSDNWMNKMPLNFQSNMNHHDFGTGGLTGSPNFGSQSYNSPVGGNYNNRDYRDGGNNIMGSGGGGGGYRHNNNQRNNQNHNSHNNYNNHNRYNNKHNQHNNSPHNNYNNNPNNKQLPPRFKQNLITPPPADTFENFQFRPATNSLLYQGVNFKTSQLPMQHQPRPTSASSIENAGSGSNNGLANSTANLSLNNINHANNAVAAASAQSTTSNVITTNNQQSPPNNRAPVVVAPMPVAPVAAPPVNNILNKEQVLIKQASTEKSRQNKKNKGPSKEDVLKCVVSFVRENLADTDAENEKNMDDIVADFIELKVPDKFMRDSVTAILNEIVDKSELTHERVIEFFGCIKKDGKLQSNAILDGFKALINGMSDSPVPRIATLVAALLYRAVTTKLCRLADVAHYTENGAHYPLFLLVLQQLHKHLGKQALTEIFAESKVNLMTTLPEADRTKDRMAEILEDRSLSFLYPLLKLQGELQKQIQTDPNPQVIYKWIKDNVDAVCYTDPGFITALMNVILKYVTQVRVRKHCSIVHFPNF